MKIFSEKKMEYDEYLEQLKGAIASSAVNCSLNTKIGIEALTKMDTKELRDKMMDVSMFVDKELSGTSIHLNNFQSLSTIMCIANILANYNEYVAELNNEQLSLLGQFYHSVDNEGIKSHLEVFGDKTVLEPIMQKTEDTEERKSILQVVESKQFDLCINSDNPMSTSDFKQFAIGLVQNNSKDELLQMNRPIEEVAKELGEQGYKI